MDYLDISDIFYESLYGCRDLSFKEHMRNCKFCRDKYYRRIREPAWKRWVDSVLSERDVDHHLRFDVVTILLYVGWDEDKIISYILKNARWDDKDARYTEYQVRHIARNGYHMRRRIKDLLFRKKIYKNPFTGYPVE